VTRRQWILFSILAAFWGASYLFIEIALDDLSPPMIVCARTLLAAAVLFPFAASRGALTGVRERLGAIAVLAALQVAGPFLLISYGQRDIASSLAGILVAGAPIFTALLAVFIDQDERSHGLSLVGVVTGIAGVTVLLGVDTGGGTAALVGGLMVVLASLGYALGSFYLKHRLTGLAPTGVGAATMAVGSLMALPFALATAPAEAPGLGPIAALATLGILGTGVSFGIFYTLLAEIGPARASVVAYVAPGFAVAYGVVLLDETFTLATAAGIALILGGSWLAAEGRLPWKPRLVRPARRELAAGGVDVAAASQPHRGG
jgi:drug/metabolite transporter (DMT)-like permease